MLTLGYSVSVDGHSTDFGISPVGGLIAGACGCAISLPFSGGRHTIVVTAYGAVRPNHLSPDTGGSCRQLRAGPMRIWWVRPFPSMAEIRLRRTGGSLSTRWQWGDGTSATILLVTDASHVFNSAGTFTVTLTTTDNSGATASATVAAVITGSVLSTSLPPPSGPVLSATPSSVQPGGTIQLTWSGIPSSSATDWIGIYSPTAPDTCTTIGCTSRARRIPRCRAPPARVACRWTSRRGRISCGSLRVTPTEESSRTPPSYRRSRLEARRLLHPRARPRQRGRCSVRRQARFNRAGRSSSRGRGFRHRLPPTGSGYTAPLRQIPRTTIGCTSRARKIPRCRAPPARVACRWTSRRGRISCGSLRVTPTEESSRTPPSYRRSWLEARRLLHRRRSRSRRPQPPSDREERFKSRGRESHRRLPSIGSAFSIPRRKTTTSMIGCTSRADGIPRCHAPPARATGRSTSRLERISYG